MSTRKSLPPLTAWIRNRQAACALVLGVAAMIGSTQAHADTHTTLSVQPVPINDFQTANMFLIISDSFTITDLNVTVMIEHTYDADLEIVVRHPNGLGIPLSFGNGGSGNDFRATTFDDEAATSIGSGSPPFRGSFRPEVPMGLSALDGTSAQGTWRLEVEDTAGGDVGQILCYSLAFNGETYVSTNVPVGIVDLTTVQSTLNVSDAFTVGDVDVTIDLSHTWDADLVVRLRAPNGAVAQLFSNIGADGDDFRCASFDDESPFNITGSAPPYPGRWTTESGSALSALDGVQSNGQWKLEVEDQANQDTGTINDWWLSLHPGGGAAPSNDNCANAITANEAPTAFDTTGASTDGPGDCPVNQDIWYQYTPGPSCFDPSAGTLTVSLCGSSYNTVLAVYEGTNCPPTNLVACNDNSCGLQSEVAFSPTFGQTYLIRIGGSGGASGTGVFDISCEPPCEPDCSKLNIECLNPGPEYDNRRPVARLLLQQGASQIGWCTGWMIGDPDCMITNEHCVAGINVTDLRAEFDFECDACVGGQPKQTTIFNVVGLIHADAALDYALLDLAGNPAATSGTLTVSSDLPSVGSAIYEIHHASASKKGYDAGTITNIFQPGTCASGTTIELAISAIASQGASGSPVFSATTHAVEAICHCGPPCTSGFAVPLSAVLPDALPHIQGHGCTVDVIGGQTTSFSGQVTDCSTAGGLSGASVTWGSYNTTTNGSGNYSFSGLPCESNTLFVTNSGYQGSSQSYTPTCDTANVKNVCLNAEDLNIVGEVTDCTNGSGINGASVQWGPFNTTTNSSGDYSLANVPCGSHTLTITAAGFQDFSQPYTPTCETTNFKDVCLGSNATDVATFTDSITLSAVGQDVDADITVDNLGGATANNVSVELFKRTGPSSFVLSGSDTIPVINSGSSGSSSILFTPDFAGQQVRVVALLPNPSDDPDLSNNEALVIWNGVGVSPVVVQIQTQFDGNSSPNTAGRYVADVPLDNTFFAVVQAGSAAVSSVSFQIDADPPVVSTPAPDGRWAATFDVGQLAGDEPHTLTVIATDAAAQSSTPKTLGLNVLSMPPWAEPWNSTFDPVYNQYKLSGFVPIEWRFDQTLPEDWSIIADLNNRFRAGLYTSAEVGLSKQVFNANMTPALYVSAFGFTILDFTVDGQMVGTGPVLLPDDLNPGVIYQDQLSFLEDLAITPGFDPDTLFLDNVSINFAKTFEHELFDVPLTPVPIRFAVLGWPMSFEADLQFAPSVMMTVTVSADGGGLMFEEPTVIQPSLNVAMSGTVNVVDVAVATVAVVLLPVADFAYAVEYVPPTWTGDWLIDFILDMCIRIRLGLGPASQDFDLGCITLYEHMWSGERSFAPPPSASFVDPLGVLNRPRIAARPGGIRALVYAGDDPGGDPSELFANLDHGSGAWDTQEQITDDDFADLDPAIAYTNDNLAVAVWTKVKTLAQDVGTSSIDQLIGSQDLYWAKRQGSAFTPLDSGTDSVVTALAAVDTGAGALLYAGGSFTQAGGSTSSSIGAWNGSVWTEPDGGTDCAVQSMTGFDDGTGTSLYAGGCFANAGPTPAANIAEWNGVGWSSLGSGANGAVRALYAAKAGSAIGPALYAGGEFMNAGGLAANFIAKWSGSDWSTLGGGLNSVATSLTEFDDGNGSALYAGGFFTQAGGVSVGFIAKWDGAAWSPVGIGLGSIVNALTVFDDGNGQSLYAGGAFTSAGGARANYIAKWDGTSWSPLGIGLDNWVYALTVFDDGSGPALYAGGLFTNAGGLPAGHVAKWDGTSWSAVGVNGVNSFVFALTSFDDGNGLALYAGGDFTQADGIMANRIARWADASWSPPVPLTDDFAADGLAQVAFSQIASNGLVLWCRDTAADFDDVSADEVAYAVWDGKGWSAPALLTNDALGDRSIAVCYREGTQEAVAVWTKETDPIDHNLNLHYAEWDGAAWSLPAPVRTHTAEQTSQVNAASLSDGRVLAAWAAQADDGWRINIAVFESGIGWSPVETVLNRHTLVDGLQLQISDNDDVYLFWHGFDSEDDLFGISKAFINPGAPWVGPTRLTGGPEIEWQPTGNINIGGDLDLVYARLVTDPGLESGGPGNGLPAELGSASVPANGNWRVTDSDLMLVGDPWVGQSVNVEATLTNSGATDSLATTARFWLGDPGDPKSTPIGVAINLSPLTPAATIVIASAPIALATPGSIDVFVVVESPLGEGDPSDNQASLDVNVVYNDGVSPQVTSVEIIPLLGEDRLGVDLIVTFDEPVAATAPQDVVLVGANSGLTVADQVWSDAGGTVMHVVHEDHLSEDTYTFTAKATITDPAGNALDGNGDGTAGDDFFFVFDLLRGDIDGDGDVDTDDLNALVAVLLGAPFDPEHVARADQDGDGASNGGDVQPFIEAFLGAG